VKKLLFISIFLYGCAPINQQSDPRDIKGIDPAFASYVQQFEVMYGHHIGDIPIQFAPQSGQVIGECIVWNSQWREIKVDPYFWANEALDDTQREALIFHELGHCVLNRGHLNTMFTDVDAYGNRWYVDTSIMNAYIFLSAQYPDIYKLEPYYWAELFNPAPGAPLLGGSSGEADDDFVNINTEDKHGI